MPELISVRDIQLFLEFANVYYCFIQGFSKIARLFILMLKIGSPSPFENFLNKIVVDNDMVGKSNDSGQILAKSKKLKNHRILAKSRKSNHQRKLFKFKKAILDKSKILVNLTLATNADAIEYLTLEARIAFT